MRLSEFELQRPLPGTDLGARYRALDPQQRPVELHVFRGPRPEQETWRAVLKRIRLASFVHERSLQQVLEMATDQDPPFVVLEAIEGPSLHTRIATGKLPVRDALEQGKWLAEGLVAAHRLRLVHGAIDPEHIVTRGNDWVLVWPDWRIGQARTADALALSFLAPEQRDTGDLEPASDIYSLMSVLQWLLDGRQSAWGDAAQEWTALWEECREVEPASRPTAAQLVTRLTKVIAGIASENSASGYQFDDATIMQVTGAAAPSMATSTSQSHALRSLPKQLGRYELLDQLGEGGMGTVFRARDISDGSWVALKLLSSELAGDELSLRRFAKEARMLARANNPFVARLLEFDEDAGVPYLAVEFVAGGSVGDRLKQEGGFEERTAIALIADALRGLTVAHQRGIVHRDIKPDNLLLTEAGAEFLAGGNANEMPEPGVPLVKLGDFGLARGAQQSESLAITHDGTLLGTPLYMSPEQCRGLPADPRSDVYSMGATLFHLLTGRPPFVAETHVAVMNQHCQEPPPALRKLRPQLSEAIELIVEKALAKNPEARFQSATEFLGELDQILRGAPTSIGFHPVRPVTNGQSVVTFEFHWDLSSPPEKLWPHVSNTDRINQAMGLPAVRYTTQTDSQGVRRFAQASVVGQPLAWEEHPYEWVEGRRMSVLREFTRGPFRWFISAVELRPRAGGGTSLTQAIHVVPQGIIWRWLAQFEIGFKARKSLARVYEQIDRYVSAAGERDPGSDPFRTPTLLSSARRTKLQQRLQRLQARSLNPAVVSTLGQFLEHASDQEVARIRPFAFARRFDLDPDEVVETCLRAAQEGLLTLLWDLLCPTCRIPADIQETLASLRDHGYCQACDANFELDFANSVEVIFRAHPEIRNVETKTYCIGGPAFSSHVVVQTRLAPQERFEAELALEEGMYRVRGPQLPFVIDFPVASRGSVGRWELALSKPVAAELLPVLRPGSQVFVLTNDTSRDLIVRLERRASRGDALTAADASSRASFREIFPDQVLTPGQMVSIASLTLLLVRVHQSAEWYRRMGDGPAFRTIRQLFDLAQSTVARRGGAVVKIVGDGLVMSFNDSVAAVHSALDLLEGARRQGSELPLQLAAHRGSALVTTLNDRLDYFGQTVHTVTELLAGAERNELLLTDEIGGLPEVAAVLIDRHIKVDVSGSATAPTYRCTEH